MTTRIDLYDARGNDPDRWRSHGASLNGVADLLEGRYRQRAPDAAPLGFFPLFGALLLRAFAFECFFKALWLAQGHKLARAGRFQPIRGVDNHDLSALADKTQFALAQAERETLDLLTTYGVWARYPIATNSQQERRGHTWSDAHGRHLKAVLARLHLQIDAAQASQPPGRAPL